MPAFRCRCSGASPRRRPSSGATPTCTASGCRPPPPASSPLVDVDADPLTSREHILVSTILKHGWDADRDLDIGALIGAIQNPPVERIGVVDVESFYPAKDRFALAMRLNNLLAAPGFEVWMQGVPLDAGSLFFNADGKPRLSVMSIAHLSDSERMFFVTMLLGEILAWMRRQSGTGTLRAILYMDEIFGYLPPTANPPSKVLFLTLLKQARAYGLGVVLATQNPVDLDYKALSNTGFGSSAGCRPSATRRGSWRAWKGRRPAERSTAAAWSASWRAWASAASCCTTCTRTRRSCSPRAGSCPTSPDP
ncbi:MAG: hypothetical protein M5U09_08335 [Gammaproteobacteria bacterium]|nr:hypothetical protein [Gammaproteobacteria bacterium]